jgi:hypothetical protein
MYQLLPGILAFLSGSVLRRVVALWLESAISDVELSSFGWKIHLLRPVPGHPYSWTDCGSDGAYLFHICYDAECSVDQPHYAYM